MSIFSIFKSRDKPQNRTASSSYNFLFGGSTSGKNVNERSAMQMTAVYVCVRILSEVIAGLPLVALFFDAFSGLSDRLAKWDEYGTHTSAVTDTVSTQTAVSSASYQGAT